MEQQQLSFITDENVKQHSRFARQLVISPKTKLVLPCNPVIVFLNIYPKELKTCAHEKYLQTNIYIRALFIVAQTEKQQTRFSVGKYMVINKPGHTCSEYYSGIKRNELSVHEKTDRKLKNHIIKWFHVSCTQILYY